jgi:hypothetical protein
MLELGVNMAKDYLAEAKALHKHALEEFRRGVQENDEMVIRDAAEKAWNAVVQATNYLFEKTRGPVPRSHFHRRKGLLELGKTVPAIKRRNLVDRYMAREQMLHEMCFYEGIYDRSILEENFDKVKKFITDVEEVAQADGTITTKKP